MGLLTALVSWHCIMINEVLVGLMIPLTRLSAKFWYNIDPTILSLSSLSLSVALVDEVLKAP